MPLRLPRLFYCFLLRTTSSLPCFGRSSSSHPQFETLLFPALSAHYPSRGTDLIVAAVFRELMQKHGLQHNRISTDLRCLDETISI